MKCAIYPFAAFLLLALSNCTQMGSEQMDYGQVRIANGSLENKDVEALWLIYQLNYQRQYFYPPLSSAGVDSSVFYHGFEVNHILETVTYLPKWGMYHFYYSVENDEGEHLWHGDGYDAICFFPSGDFAALGFGSKLTIRSDANLVLSHTMKNYPDFEKSLKENKSKLSPRLRQVAKRKGIF